MRDSRLRMALTGLASGALLSGPLVGLFVLGARAGLAAVPFTVFEWFSRVLPSRIVLFGLDLALQVLRGLGLTVAEPARTAEQFLAVAALFVAGLVVGLLFFILVKNRDRGRVRLYGLIVGAVAGLFALVVTFVEGAGANAAENVLNAVWIVGLFVLWGAGLARLHRAVYSSGRSRPRESPYEASAPVGTEGIQRPDTTRPEAREWPAPVGQARVLTRRRFIVEIGGLAATIVVVGAGLGEVLRSRTIPAPGAARAPIPFPNAGSAVKPVPGTRPEYTAVSDHYRVDINLEPPSVNGTAWRLPVDGQVSNPLSLTLDQIRSDYRSQDLFVTLSCISNPLGGSLVGTTLWTGVPFRDILAQAQPLPSAHYAHITAADGFDEVVEIATAAADARIMLVYEWNGEPIPEKHGYPLRIYIPNLYGMKQPKWITGINLVPDFINGYWVVRGWDRTASMKTTSVIDTVAMDSIDIRGGRMYVPIGGIAHAGERGISKVEVQVDGGMWEEAELRQPLSQLTWVIWRFDWPFAEGNHRFAVRATDGQGQLQETESQQAFPSGATGIYEKNAEIILPRIIADAGKEHDT
jgi:DMSO/TMAO reductase YedYZ molybdopterin-dependent catalytic subunit